MDTTTYYSTGGDAFFIDKIANTLGIHPSTINIVGVRRGSTIVDFIIIPNTEVVEG